MARHRRVARTRRARYLDRISLCGPCVLGSNPVSFQKSLLYFQSFLLVNNFLMVCPCKINIIIKYIFDIEKEYVDEEMADGSDE